jgi:hypothetical protein
MEASEIVNDELQRCAPCEKYFEMAGNRGIYHKGSPRRTQSRRALAR